MAEPSGEPAAVYVALQAQRRAALEEARRVQEEPSPLRALVRAPPPPSPAQPGE